QVSYRSLLHSTLSFSAALLIRALHSFPTRRSSDLVIENDWMPAPWLAIARPPETLAGRSSTVDLNHAAALAAWSSRASRSISARSEEHTSELQSLRHLVCRLLLEKKKHTDSKLHTD